MNRHRIVHRQNGEILYEGHFPTLAACAEQAVRDGVSLDYADLSRANLFNAVLDEASLRHASFNGANLAGANLSEARLERADFTDAALQNTCFCFSAMRYCTFDGCAFGATDVAGCDLSFSHFSTLSALGLNFRDAKTMTGCVYQEDGAPAIPFSVPPVVIQGLFYPVAFFECHVKIGPTIQSYAELERYTNDNRPARRLAAGSAHVFIRRYRHMLRAVIAALPAETENIGKTA